MRYNATVVMAYYRDMGLPAPTFEHRFDPARKWRFDMAWPEHMLALEVEGGVWTQGRHSRGTGMKSDMEKYNAATLAGWRVLRCVPDDVCILETVEMIRRIVMTEEIKPTGGEA